MRLETSSKYKAVEWGVEQHTINLAVRVLGLELADFGEYTCVAENAHGRDQGTLHLYGENCSSRR